jgi:carbamoyltransferase
MSLLHIHFHHDSSIGFSPYTGEYRIFELERFTKERYFAIDFETPIYTETLSEVIKDKAEKCIKKIADCITEEYGKEYLTITEFSCDQRLWNRDNIYNYIIELIKKYFIIVPKTITSVDHHLSHAQSAFYQSPYKEAIVFSYDAGGWEANRIKAEYTTVWYFNRNQFYKKLATLPLSPVAFYTAMAFFCDDVNQGSWNTMAGKAMGLQSYGFTDPNLYNYLYPGFAGKNDIGWSHPTCSVDFTSPYMCFIKEHFFGGKPSLAFNDAIRLLATSQHVFEDVMIKTIEPFVEKYNLPVVLSGGGALNVICNSRIKNHFKLPVFVPCNPNDSGVAIGNILSIRNPQEQVKLAYNNFDLFDRDKLDYYVKTRNATSFTNADVINLIRSGKIIGVVRGRSECGPRALGNRSIICDPSFPNMKNILNSKVKQREWYRPFAPAVLEEDSKEYFVWDGSPSPYMSFSAHVKMEYQQQLASITHADFTARLQTVNKSDNPWFYNLLKDMKTTGLPVLLNTSFNIRGKPILNSIEDALYVLDNTELDYVIVEDYIFSK